MPGLDTSSVYSPLIGSSTSSTADTARLIRAQSVDLDAALGPLGHDLQRGALAAHQPQAHQLEAQTFDGRA